MAADLHIHVVPDDLEEGVIAAFFSLTIGSKHFSGFGRGRVSPEAQERAFSRIADTPNVWIGEVSWLKAALFGDSGTFVPSTVQLVQDAIGEDLPTLDDELERKILAAFEATNATGYNVAGQADVRAFLIEHKGKRLFTVSW
jgi:hypothetical protein